VEELMSKQTGYARNIFFSIIISLLVLLALGFLSIKYLVPIYDLQSQDIYQFLIYLLPVLIGLVLIEIGSIISSKEYKSYSDSEDLLPKNSYDEPLFSTINDDPSDKVDEESFNAISKFQQNEYTLDDFLDKRISDKLSEYSTDQLLDIFDNFENPKTIIESPFEEDITDKLSNFDTEQLLKAINWLKQGAKEVDEKAVVFDNISEDTALKLKDLSQREADKALEYIEKQGKYFDLDNIEEKNLCALSKLSNDDISKALKWIALGCPKAENPDSIILENIDKDTSARLRYYNSTQVNVGLDYIDQGAPDIAPSEFVKLNNLSEKTLNRLSTLDDSSVLKSLDFLEKEFVNELDNNTIDRLNSYNKGQINSALDFLENGSKNIQEDLPFGNDINQAIRNLSFDEAKRAIDYIKNPEDFDFDLGDLSNNLEDFLNSELKDNDEEGYNFDIAIAVFDKENILDNDKKDILFSYLPSYTYVYDTEYNHKTIVFPYENVKSAKKHIDNLLNEHNNLLKGENLKIGYACRNGRKIDAKTLINEAYLN